MEAKEFHLTLLYFFLFYHLASGASKLEIFPVPALLLFCPAPLKIQSNGLEKLPDQIKKQYKTNSDSFRSLVTVASCTSGRIAHIVACQIQAPEALLEKTPSLYDTHDVHTGNQGPEV